LPYTALPVVRFNDIRTFFWFRHKSITFASYYISVYARTANPTEAANLVGARLALIGYLPKPDQRGALSTVSFGFALAVTQLFRPYRAESIASSSGSPPTFNKSPGLNHLRVAMYF
jgi:hypothetical protein